jgi:AraC family transcriptional regulator
LPIVNDPYIGLQQARAEAGGFVFGHWLSPKRARRVEPHGHAEAHFILVTAGDFMTDAAGNAGPGDPLLVFNPPGTYHADRFHAGGAFFSVTVPATADEAAREFATPCAPTSIESVDALASVQRLARECLDWDHDSPFVAEAHCLELVGAAARRRSKERRPPAWLDRACQLLRDAPQQALNVYAVALEIGVHPIHLTRVFRDHLACTPGEYLRAHRARRAASLLAQSRLSLAHIADECGFADQSHLTHCFKRSYGVAPDRFRRILA